MNIRPCKLAQLPLRHRDGRDFLAESILWQLVADREPDHGRTRSHGTLEKSFLSKVYTFSRPSAFTKQARYASV